ncbi:pyruvate dehydrogenase kinase [Mortierella sp. GBAus27b]|nr:pyruvate dehydrogenase kinase [Mortierella sp. GBAus27b]
MDFTVQQHTKEQPQHHKEARRRYSPQHFYQNRILDPYVNQPVSPITLRQLVFFGRNMQEDKLLKSANYVRTELPIRLAHRIRDFQNLPFIVGTNPHIELVYDLYWQAFEKLSRVPEVKTLEENDTFCELIKGLLNDHLVVIPQLALGIMESSKHIPAEQVDRFMNKMLRSRISRRVLAEQHISLTSNFNSPNHMMTDRGYIGIIYTHCRPRDIVERTALLAAETCRQGSGGMDPPKVLLDGNIDAEFSYIPDHIEYILYELLKNSMRFVMKNGIPDSRTGELPPIQITVCEGTHDIVFRISDKGGGIHPDMESHLWSYAQSPARFANFQKISKMAATSHQQTVIDPSQSRAQANKPGHLDGTTRQYNDQSLHLGIGLPMSRVYAEYWGGDLKVFTMHGYGTDAYAKFCKFGNIYENFDV